MRYFIGFLIKGPAREWHTSTTKSISEKFNTWKIYEKLPPHITLFYPEGVEDITDIKVFIKNWIYNKKISGNFKMSGYDRFDDKVVFAKIHADEVVFNTVEDLRNGIRSISGIKNESFPNWHPHSTLAYKLEPEEINKIWEHTSILPKPNFVLPFDNVTVFRYTGDKKWVIDESFDVI
jgi:2'-5' RNA ligase